MRDPYRVIVDNEGCEHCGAGKLWTVIGPDEVCIGCSYSDEVDAEETAGMLNHAHELARRSPAAAMSIRTDPAAVERAKEIVLRAAAKIQEEREQAQRERS